MQFLLHFPVFLYHLPRCTYGISCPSARHETELLFSYACLIPQSSVDYSFPNLHGMRYHLDASTIPTIIDFPLLFEYWHNHAVPPFLWYFLLLANLLEQIQLRINPKYQYGHNFTVYLHACFVLQTTIEAMTQ